MDEEKVVDVVRRSVSVHWQWFVTGLKLLHRKLLNSFSQTTSVNEVAVIAKRPKEFENVVRRARVVPRLRLDDNRWVWTLQQFLLILRSALIS